MQAQAIRSVKRLGRQRALDFEVAHTDHNFFAEGVVVSNCHSIAYGKLTAYTLWFKAHHPLAFFWAQFQMIRVESERYEKLAIAEKELRSLGFTLLPPRLALDGMDFRIESAKEIRCALGMVRGISKENEAKLAMFIGKTGLTTTSTKFEVFQAMKNAGLNVAVGSALIQAGCMGGYDGYTNKDGAVYHSRSRLVLEWNLWAKSNLLNDKERGHCLHIEREMGSDVLRAVKHLVDVARDEKDKPLIKPSRFETIRKHYQPAKEIYLQNSANERLACFWYERTVLGYSYSETLRGVFGEEVDGLLSIDQASRLPKNAKVRLIGFVQKPTTGKTKKGNDQLSFRLEDETGETRVKAFNELMHKVKEDNGRFPIDGDLCICNAKQMDGSFFITPGPDGVGIGIVTSQIYMRYSDLRDNQDTQDTHTAVS